MALAPLPAQNSVAWYPWAQSLHNNVSSSPSTAGLRFALANGLSTGFSWHGDSTEVSDGTDNTDLRGPVRLAKLIAAAYPNYHVLSRLWDAGNQRFAAPVVLQSAAGGQAYTNFGQRSVRYPSSLFSTGNLDLRIKLDAGVTSGQQVLIAQDAGDNVTFGTAFVFRWVINTDGTMLLGISYNGAAFDNFSSTATLPASFTGLWLRATCQITADATNGSIAVNFYTGTDGVNWTQLGATAGPYVGPRSAMYATTLSNFEVGAEAWQPAAQPLTGKVYEVEIRDGIDGPLLAPALPRLWERYPDPFTTYGGAPTLYLINASAGGADLAYHTDPTRLKKLTPDYGQVTAFFADSHNEVGKSGPVTWLAPYKAWVDAVLARLPGAAPIAVAQNPHTSAWIHESEYGVSHVKRLGELATYAGRQGWGLLDLYSAYMADSRGLSVLIDPDGFHPSQTGYALTGTTAASLVGIN